MDRKQYYRDRQARIYADFKIRRVLILEKLGGKCDKCGKVATKGLHLHHEIYHPTESDYPRRGKTMSDRLKRLAEAETHPERFRLLCPRCHTRLELDKFKATTPF